MTANILLLVDVDVTDFLPLPLMKSFVKVKRAWILPVITSTIDFEILCADEVFNYC
jgi:hypothetical protein